MISERMEETARVEFKRQLPPSGQNDDMAKLITAMANSDGGVIIYGIDEEDSAAGAISAIELTGAAERVAVVARGVDEPVELTGAYGVETEDDGRGVLVIEVARSSRAPHFYKGIAYSRSTRTTAVLSRREVGERFARSPGFAQEFGLAVGRPGRIKFDMRTEPRPASGTSTGTALFWVFENDGDVEVRDANWHLVPDEPAPTLHVLRNPFPRDVFHAGERLVLPVSLTMGGGPPEEIATSWIDLNGEGHELTWAITWA